MMIESDHTEREKMIESEITQHSAISHHTSEDPTTAEEPILDETRYSSVREEETHKKKAIEFREGSTYAGTYC